jgi:hypothetical protein
MQNGFEILSEMTIKSNSILDTNDPWENKLQLYNICDLPIYSNDIIGLQNRFAEIELLNKANTESYKIINRFNTLCFSKSFRYKNKTISGYNQPRMWTQYSRNHEGFCFEFDLDLLISKIIASFPNDFIKFGNVKYNCAFEKFNHPLRHDLSIEEFIKKNYEIIFFNKNINWKDEHEFRIIIYNTDNIKIHIDDCIKAIYLGAKFNTTYYPLLDYYTKDKNIHIFDIVLKSMEFEKRDYKLFTKV